MYNFKITDCTPIVRPLASVAIEPRLALVPAVVSRTELQRLAVVAFNACVEAKWNRRQCGVERHPIVDPHWSVQFQKILDL